MAKKVELLTAFDETKCASTSCGVVQVADVVDCPTPAQKAEADRLRASSGARARAEPPEVGAAARGGECPDRGKSPATIVLRTYWISEYSMSIVDAHSRKEVWTPREPMFFVNRRFVQTVCLDDWSSSCYEFTLRDAGKEGLMDGSCSISWGSGRDRALVGNIRGAFGESQSIRFGKGC